MDICNDSAGNLYLADEVNGRIRKINLAGIITTIAGNGIAGFTGDGGSALTAQIKPHCITIDKFGNVYMGDYYTFRVRKIDVLGNISTILGNGSSGFSGDGLLATSAKIGHPGGISTDSCGNVYLCDANNYRIRKVTFDTSCGSIQDTPSHVGVINVNSSKAISVYPNPVWNEMHVDGINATVEYTLYDLTGRQVMKGMLQPGSNKLNMQLLIQGIYTLQVQDGTGKREVWKVVKE